MSSMDESSNLNDYNPQSLNIPTFSLPVKSFIHLNRDNSNNSNSNNFNNNNNTNNNMIHNNISHSSTISSYDNNDVNSANLSLSLDCISNEISNLEEDEKEKLSIIQQSYIKKISETTNPLSSLPNQSGFSLAFHSSIVQSFDKIHHLGLNKKNTMARKLKKKKEKLAKKAEERSDKILNKSNKYNYKFQQKKKAKY